MGWLEDPYTEHVALAEVERRKARLRALQQLATPKIAADLAYASTLHPTASPELLTGMVMSGMPTDDDMALAAVEYEARQKTESGGLFGALADIGGGLIDAVQGTVRWLALGFDGVMDELIDRPLRTAANLKNGMDLGEAYAASGDAPFGAFGEALGVINPFQEGGARELNIGGGWLPQSNLAVPVTEALAQLQKDVAAIGSQEGAVPWQRADQELVDEIYSRYVDEYNYIPPTFLPPAQQAMMLQSQIEHQIMEQASDPDNARFGSEQAKYGAPVVQRQMAEKNSVVLDMASLGTSGPNYQQVSLGRVFAGLVTESGSEPFHYVSGALDFAKQVGMDPTNIAAGGIAKGMKALKTIDVGADGQKIIAAANAAKDEVAQLGAQIDELASTGPVARISQWAPSTQRRAYGHAQAGHTVDDVAAGVVSPTDLKYQEIARKALEEKRARARLHEIINDPDFIRYQSYADSTRENLTMLDELTKAERSGRFKRNQRLIGQYERHQRAAAIRAEMVELGQRVETLRNSDEVKRFNSWAESTRQRALNLAEQADIDPSVNPKLAKEQQTARDALAVMDEANQIGQTMQKLDETANIGYQLRKDAGLLDGPRKDIDAKQVSNYISGPGARRWVDELASADAAKVDDLLSHVRTTVPRELRSELVDAKTRAEVVEALLPYIDKGLIQTRSTKGALRRLANAMKSDTTLVYGVNRKRLDARFGNGPKATPLFAGGRLQRAISEMSPRSLDLNQLDKGYEQLIHYAENIGWQRGDKLLEGHLDKFRDLVEGDHVAAFKVLNDFRADSINRLVEGGLDKNVAAEVTRFIGEEGQMAIYFTDDSGKVMDDAIAFLDNGKAMNIGSPHLHSELFKGVVNMPDSRLVRHAAAELDRIGQLTNMIATKGAAANFEQRVIVRLANDVMTKLWKPLVLLRPAWPIRVIGEEQVRMLAAGITQPFEHPLHTIARVFGHRGKSLDALGDAMSQTDEFVEAMAGRISFQGDYRPRGVGRWQRMNRAEVPHATYRDALIGELNQLWSDPVVQHLFRNVDGVEALTDADRIKSVVRWMRTDPVGKNVLDELTTNADMTWRNSVMTNDKALTQYVQSVYARAHQKAGGEWVLHDPRRGLTFTSKGDVSITPPDVLATLDGPTYQIVRPGVKEITDSYATRQWRGMQVAERFVNSEAGALANPRAPMMADIRKAMDDLLRSEQGQNMPTWVKGAATAPGDRVSQLDQTVTTMFNWLMSKPTNRLSRSPAFAEFYWQRLGQLAPHMDEATLKAARKAADAAGSAYRKRFDDAARQITGQTSTIKNMRGRDITPGGGLKDLKEADQIAKATALTEVQDLLFDVSKRSNIADAMSIIAPFADAWYEVISTWAKIIRQQNVKPLRRIQQVVEGARESNIGDPASGYSNEGFLRERDGREVFVMPGLNSLWQKMSGLPSDWEISPSQLSIATDVLPALGPVAQIAVQPLVPAEPGWDWLRGYTEPMGKRSMVQQFVPSYMQRMMGAMGITGENGWLKDEELQRLYTSTVADVLNHMARSDPNFDAMNIENQEALIKEARARASQVWWVQALARFVGPAAPSMRPLAEDKNGFVWQTAVLQDAYYDILQEHQGDLIAANEDFYSMFGFQPYTVTTSKSAEVEKRSATAVGHNFQRMNPELFEKYPNTAYYLGPANLEDYAPFDWTAYHAQLLEGSREPLSDDEYLMMMNDSKGRLAYEAKVYEIEQFHGRKLNEGGWDTALKEQIQDELREFDSMLRLRFNGYQGAGINTDVPGVPGRVSNQIRIDEIRKMIAMEPELVGQNPALTAAAQYLQLYDLLAEGANVSGAGELATSGAGDPTNLNYQRRMDLRQLAAYLVQQYPEFGPMWEEVFGVELTDDVEPEMTIEDAYDFAFGGG